MNPKAIVRAGYDRVSQAYRGDSIDPSDPALGQYAGWLGELAALISPSAPVLDLGCGNGVPVARLLAEAGFAVTGADLSPVQIEGQPGQFWRGLHCRDRLVLRNHPPAPGRAAGAVCVDRRLAAPGRLPHGYGGRGCLDRHRGKLARREGWADVLEPCRRRNL